MKRNITFLIGIGIIIILYISFSMITNFEGYKSDNNLANEISQNDEMEVLEEMKYVEGDAATESDRIIKLLNSSDNNKHKDAKQRIKNSCSFLYENVNTLSIPNIDNDDDRLMDILFHSAIICNLSDRYGHMTNQSTKDINSNSIIIFANEVHNLVINIITNSDFENSNVYQFNTQFEEEVSNLDSNINDLVNSILLLVD